MTDPSPLAESLLRVVVDPSLERRVIDGFQFPLGVHPTEPLTPTPGYTVQFEPADGSDPSEFAGVAMGEQLEEWPDRYVFDILISHERLRPLCRALFSFLPGRFFPILDILGHDAFREIDPYIAYEPVGCEKFHDGLRFFDPFLFEDGLVGFGAMSLDPFFYVFVDEHKIVTLRVTPEMKDKAERLLAAFDLSPAEELASVDSVAHEHRGVLALPDDRPDALTADEVIEAYRENWLLQLNIDPLTNVDADGNDLGLTAWQCIARCRSAEEDQPDSYAEILLTAGCLQEAEEHAAAAVAPPGAETPQWGDVDIIRADRITPEQLDEWLGKDRSVPRDKVGVHDVRWLTGGPLKPKPSE